VASHSMLQNIAWAFSRRARRRPWWCSWGSRRSRRSSRWWRRRDGGDVSRHFGVVLGRLRRGVVIVFGRVVQAG
jgi:hypothetical protein